MYAHICNIPHAQLADRVRSPVQCILSVSQPCSKCCFVLTLYTDRPRRIYNPDRVSHTGSFVFCGIPGGSVSYFHERKHPCYYSDMFAGALTQLYVSTKRLLGNVHGHELMPALSSNVRVSLNHTVTSLICLSYAQYAASAWISSNTEGSYKRSAALGIIIGWRVHHLMLDHALMWCSVSRGNLNGAVTSNVVSHPVCY